MNEILGIIFYILIGISLFCFVLFIVHEIRLLKMFRFDDKPSFEKRTKPNPVLPSLIFFLFLIESIIASLNVPQNHKDQHIASLFLLPCFLLGTVLFFFYFFLYKKRQLKKYYREQFESFWKDRKKKTDYITYYLLSIAPFFLSLGLLFGYLTVFVFPLA